MVLSRRLLFRSGIWEIAVPRHPLTAGHVLIRLSDPSTEFTEASAADWLFCHNLARAALEDVLGAKRFAVMFANRWHPLGSAIGEPVAESSTPTFHLFARWEAESTTPGRQLALPAHHRVPEPEDSPTSSMRGSGFRWVLVPPPSRKHPPGRWRPCRRPRPASYPFRCRFPWSRQLTQRAITA